jgi:hypothetical protein
MAQNYKKAFKCHKCPQSNQEDGCPVWNEVILTHSETGQEKIVKGCNFQILPFLITESIKASNVSTGTFSSIKNEIARGYAVIAQSMPEFVTAISAKLEKDQKQLPDTLESGN